MPIRIIIVEMVPLMMKNKIDPLTV